MVQFTQFATIEYETREIARVLFTFGFSIPIIFPTLNNLGLLECVIAESLAVDSQIFGIHIIPLLERQEDPKERLIFKSFETFPHLEQIHHQLNEKILSQPHSDKIFWNVSVWDESKTPDPHSLYFFWRTANLIRQFGHQVELTLFSLIPEDPKTHPAINLDIPSPWFLVRYLLTKHSLAEATEYLGSQPGPKFDEKRKASIFIFDHPQAINYKDEARIFGKQGQVFLKTLYTTSENDAVYKFGNPPESSSLPMTQPSINFFLRGHPRSILTAAVNTAAFVWPA